MRNNTIESFWTKVDCSGKCWLWMGAKDKDGYGFFWWKNKQIRAHRFVKAIIKKECIGNKQVCHICDNPSCVRPSHLFVGSALDNAKDRDSKKRGTKGRKQSTEHITKKANARRGKMWTQEMKDRMSRIKRGIS